MPNTKNGKDMVKAIQRENPRYVKPIIDPETGDKIDEVCELFGEGITEAGEACLVLKRNQIVMLPTAIAVEYVKARIATPHVKVDPAFGFAPEPPLPPAHNNALIDQGDASADIEAAVAKTLGKGRSNAPADGKADGKPEDNK